MVAPPTANRAPLNPADRELHLKEADWLYQEMQDFVRLVQRYRALYITAVFAALGWLLGQMTQSGTVVSLAAVRLRQDVAAAICGFAPLNVLFFSLMLEATAQMQSLARYRFLLGVRLGEGRPTWRWERWKETEEGSIRHWTNPTNIFFAAFGLVGTVLLLVFPLPALRDAGVELWVLYLLSFVFSLALLLVVIWTGWRNRARNRVASRPSSDWWDRLDGSKA